MKCPKCGYTSFDYLESCKKCGVDLTEVKSRFNLRTILFPGAIGGNVPKVEQPASKQPIIPKADRDLPLLKQGAALHEAVAAPAGPDRDPDPGAFSFEEPNAFPLESLMAQAPAAEVPVSIPAPLSASTFAADEEGNGFAFDFGEEDDKQDGPLPWPDEAAASSPAAAADRPFPHVIPVAPSLATAGLPSGPAAAAATIPTAEMEEIEDEPIRISLEDFDRLDPEGGELSLFDSSDPLPGLEGEFAAPIGWSVAASAPLRGAPEIPLAFGEADPADTDFAAVDGDPILPAPAAAVRLAASAADLLILIVVFALFVLAGELALQPAGATPARPLTAILLDQAIPYFLVLFCLGFGYFTFFHFLLGQTLGKMLLRLRVETATGEPITFSRAFLRSTGGLLALLTAGAGYLPALRPGGRGFNDRLAGTRVVRTAER